MSGNDFDLELLTTCNQIGTLYYRDSMTSTNDVAKQLLAEELPAFPLIVLTRHQQAGRGQRTNSWWSGQGSLTFSIVVPAFEQSIPPPILALATALSVALTIENTVFDSGKSLRPKIKWPNDIYLGANKVSGILIESIATAQKRYVVIGIGCNVNCSVAQASIEDIGMATSLIDESESTVDLNRFLVRLIEQFLEIWKQTADEPAAIADQCERRSYFPIGSKLEFAQGQSITVGTFNGFSSAGELILCHNGQTVKMVSGTAVMM